MMNNGRWRGLLALCGAAMLAGCGWFGGEPLPSAKARPGADRQIAPTGTLPVDHAGRGVEQGVTPVDETRSTQQVGSVVAAKGGQKAQKEAAEKEAAERDAKAREQRAAREAAIRKAEGKDQSAPQPATPTEGVPNPPPGDTN